MALISPAAPKVIVLDVSLAAVNTTSYPFELVNAFVLYKFCLSFATAL